MARQDVPEGFFLFLSIIIFCLAVFHSSSSSKSSLFHRNSHKEKSCGKLRENQQANVFFSFLFVPCPMGKVLSSSMWKIHKTICFLRKKHLSHRKTKTYFFHRSLQAFHFSHFQKRRATFDTTSSEFSTFHPQRRMGLFHRLSQ